MVQVIQIKRKFTGAGVPASLAPGELAFNSTGNKLYVGGDLATVQGLVGSERQLEVHAASPAQTVDGGAKTFPIAKLKVPGGNVGEFLSINNADGTLTYKPMISASQQFVGSMDAAAGEVTFTAASGGTGTDLPAAGAGNNGWYVIVDTAGAVPPANAPAGNYNIGDWVISNGVDWTHLSFGGIETDMASEVGVAPTVAGGDNVQTALGGLETENDAQDVLIAANTAAIALLPTTAYVDAENDAQETAQAVTDGAQDTAIAANTAAIANKITKPAAVAAIGNIATFADVGGAAALDGGVTIAQLQASITAKGDVVGPAGAANNSIAVFDTATGKLIKDGGSTIAQITAAAGDVKGQIAPIAAADNIAVYNAVDPKAIKDGGTSVGAINTAIAANTAAIALKADATALADYLPLAGGTVTGPILLPVAAPTTNPEAANKKYVDDQILAIPGANPPLVTGPELIGDGALGSEITFTGITAEAGVFSGKGLSTDPLLLLVVDGGTYT